MKILIAVPCMDSVPSQFCQSLAVLTKVEDCAIAFQMGSLIYTSRDKLATMAVQKGVDYVLWLDSDMIFPSDVLKKLLEDRDKGDIITGIYYRRVPKYAPVLFSKLDFDEKGCLWEGWDDYPEDDVFEIEGCGFGCVLTPTNVFFDIMNKFGQMFAPIGGVGEDLSFCWRARQCGYKIIADPSIQCGHVGHYVIDKGFYDTFKRANNESQTKQSSEG